MFHIRLLLTALVSGLGLGAAPSYTAAAIVNCGSYTPGPFAPNSILSIFGKDLARSTQTLSAGDIRGGKLPTELNYTRVFVDGSPAALFFVSDEQINFLVPATQGLGATTIRIAREGISGPEVTITLVDAAPALFLNGDWAIATSATNVLLTPEAPAHARDVIVIYATGLGKTAPNPAAGEIPKDPALILKLADLKVTLGGTVLDPIYVKYAGLTPGCAGLYQINLAVPEGTASDPEIRVSIGSQSSSGGVKLPIR